MIGGAGMMPAQGPVEELTRDRYEEGKRQIVVEVALDPPHGKQWATMTLSVTAKTSMVDVDRIFMKARAALREAFK